MLKYVARVGPATLRLFESHLEKCYRVITLCKAASNNRCLPCLRVAYPHC